MSFHACLAHLLMQTPVVMHFKTLIKREFYQFSSSKIFHKKDH
ncbi:hypothetical protein BN1318_310015 [Staphylococcus capitis]|nr:hypothetical protein BN1318_310015 [Staphylococcus capitis]